jgi:GH25 family lysozyme M1 (1,4-beta-N-acetylmuramidase)
MMPRALRITAVVLLTVLAGSSGVQAGSASRAGVAAPAPRASTVTVPGVDVSAYQHGVNWKKASAKGARFAYIKATEGVDYTSARFREQYTGAAKAGLVRGAFHFAKPNVSTPVAQAEYFVKALSRLGGGRVAGSTTLPPLVDLEYDPYVRADGTDSCWGLTPKQMVLWISAFVDTVTGLTGRVPAIYTTTNWWSNCTADSAVFRQNPLFLARYVDDPAEGAGALPRGWKHWTMWQYTSRGSRYAGVTDGKKGDTPASDEDVFAGTMSELRALARSTFTDVTGLAPKAHGIPAARTILSP